MIEQLGWATMGLTAIGFVLAHATREVPLGWVILFVLGFFCGLLMVVAG